MDNLGKEHKICVIHQILHSESVQARQARCLLTAY